MSSRLIAIPCSRGQFVPVHPICQSVRRRRTDGVVPFFLLLAALPFVLPLISLARVASLRSRLDLLEETIDQQQRSLDAITRRLDDLRKQVIAPPAADAKPAAAPEPPP